MFEAYRHLRNKYPKISLYQERRLIKQAQEGSKAKKAELVERHIHFVIFRINKIVYPTYRERFGKEGNIILTKAGVKDFLIYQGMV